MNRPAVYVRAGLADMVVVEPLRSGAAFAVLADLERGEPRLTGAFDERGERVEQFVIGQAAPLQHADTARPRRELERRLPVAGELRSEEHTSELQSLAYLVCRLLLEKKK